MYCLVGYNKFLDFVVGMMGSQYRHLGRKVMGSDIHIKGITQTSVSSIY